MMRESDRAGAPLPEPEPDPDVRGDAPDLAAGLRLIEEQGRAVRAATEPDARILFGTWGLAWLVGYLAMYIGGGGQGSPGPVGGAIFGGCLLAAVVITAVHISRRAAGMRGASARQGAFYGTAWMLSFVLVFTLITALQRYAAEIETGEEIIGLAANGMSALVVAAMYMVGGAMWEDRASFLLGAWIAIIAAIATLVGMPHLYLVMALAGGGGFLVAAVVEHVRCRRSATAGGRDGR